MQDKPMASSTTFQLTELHHETLAVIGFDLLSTRLHGRDHALVPHD